MSSYLSGDTPRAFAHRGWHTGDLAGLENSLAAFTRAVGEGFRYLETDVHLTADGVLIAFHDHKLDRVTNGSGIISKLTWEQVSRAKISGREPIPRFSDIVELAESNPEIRLNIDPKTDSAVGPLIDQIREAGIADRVCIGAFADARLATVRQALGPSLATSLGPREVFKLVAASQLRRKAPKTGAVAAQIPIKSGRIPVLSKRLLDTAHRAGIEVHVWTVDDPATMIWLLDLGVDGIMTDRPDVLRDVLVARGEWTA